MTRHVFIKVVYKLKTDVCCIFWVVLKALWLMKILNWSFLLLSLNVWIKTSHKLWADWKWKMPLSETFLKHKSQLLTYFQNIWILDLISSFPGVFPHKYHISNWVLNLSTEHRKLILLRWFKVCRIKPNSTRGRSNTNRCCSDAFSNSFLLFQLQQQLCNLSLLHESHCTCTNLDRQATRFFSFYM